MSIAFEDCIDKINEELDKQKRKWTLTLPHISYDDASQIIRRHIYLKWSQYDQTRALGPWIAQIISTQIKNLVRNNFASFAKPCYNCPFSEKEGTDGEGGCAITHDGLQGPSCALYARWLASKRDAFNVRVPLSMDCPSSSGASEKVVDNQNTFDFEGSVNNMHAAMKKKLNAKLFKAYEMIYVDRHTDEEVAKFMGYRSGEKDRAAGYKQIKNLKVRFTKMAKALLESEDIIV